jgi:hypothetical protein
MNKLFRYMVKGAAAPSEVYTLRRRSYPHKTDTEAMRSDWVRVGEGIKRVIQKEERLKRA